jgi:hypothetical protein
MLHFLGEQRGAVHLDQAQYAMGGVQQIGALLQQHFLVGTFRISLERRAGVVERGGQFLGHNMQSL